MNSAAETFFLFSTLIIVVGAVQRAGMAVVAAARQLEIMGAETDQESAPGRLPRQSAGITIVIESGASARVLGDKEQEEALRLIGSPEISGASSIHHEGPVAVGPFLLQ